MKVTAERLDELERHGAYFLALDWVEVAPLVAVARTALDVPTKQCSKCGGRGDYPYAAGRGEPAGRWPCERCHATGRLPDYEEYHRKLRRVLDGEP